KSYFNLEENKVIANKKFDLYAFSHIQNQKYFANKKFKIWEYAKYEHCLIKKNTKDDSENLIPNKDFFKKAIDELVEVHRNHKQSYLSIIKIRESEFNENEINKIENLSFSKSFYLGFKGWCDLRLIAVDLKNNKVYSNQEGEKVKDNYQPEKFLNLKSSKKFDKKS
ncbi:MAG: hypothetical protein ACQEQF_11470, partial [Bacillota bacterium]